MEPLRVALIEDDEPLAGSIASALRQIGWTIERATRGEELVPMLSQAAFDAAVLDINLPGIDGFQALVAARRANIDTPILLLSAREALEDRLFGLDGGADDYLLKPFALSELIARLRALARRQSHGKGQVLKYGPLQIDKVGHSAMAGDQPLHLSPREWTLLELLILNEGTVVGKDQIVRAFAGDDLSNNAIEVYVFRLRPKLEKFGVQIRTVRGFGYMLHPWRGGQVK